MTIRKALTAATVALTLVAAPALAGGPSVATNGAGEAANSVNSNVALSSLAYSPTLDNSLSQRVAAAGTCVNTPNQQADCISLLQAIVVTLRSASGWENSSTLGQAEALLAQLGG